jgi:hypothetical protein
LVTIRRRFEGRAQLRGWAPGFMEPRYLDGRLLECRPVTIATLARPGCMKSSAGRAGCKMADVGRAPSLRMRGFPSNCHPYHIFYISNISAYSRSLWEFHSLPARTPVRRGQPVDDATGRAATGRQRQCHSTRAVFFPRGWRNFGVTGVTVTVYSIQFELPNSSLHRTKADWTGWRS